MFGMETKNIVIISLVVVIVALLGFVYWFELGVRDFDSCSRAGYPVMESYPAQCETFLGRHFVQVIEPIGGDRDEHECLITAGYSWNESEKECVREWETGDERYQINDFDSCVEAYGTTKSYPLECVTWGGRIFVEENHDNNNFYDEMEKTISEYFREEMWRRGVENMDGVMPIEGFDPDLFMGAYPGLTKEDFDGVSAVGGSWQYIGGDLEFARTSDDVFTSADGTVDVEGMDILLENLKERTGLIADTKEDVDELIDILSAVVLLPDFCPEGFFAESLNCQCAEGYVKTLAPYALPPGQESRSYCKIDKEWEEFEVCSSNDECGEGERCFSQDDTSFDYRCIPSDSYYTACGCEIDQDACWCT
jgi:hypothetical protein